MRTYILVGVQGGGYELEAAKFSIQGDYIVFYDDDDALVEALRKDTVMGFKPKKQSD